MERKAKQAYWTRQVRSVEPSSESLLLECAGGARLPLPRDCDPWWLAQVLSGLR